MITSPYRGILIRLIILTFLLELRSGLRLKRKAPGTGGESPLAEDPRSPPLSAGYPRFSSHRGDLRFRIWWQRPEGPVQALWPRHCAARMSDYFLTQQFHEQILGFKIDIWILTLSRTSNIQNLNIMFLKPLINGTTIHFLVNLHH